jgi:hypothetical protein
MIITLYQANWFGHSTSHVMLSASATRMAGRSSEATGSLVTVSQATGISNSAAIGSA